MTTDFVLACLHHLLVFGMAALLAAEMAAVRPGLDAPGLRRLTMLDAHYGAAAGLIILVGVLRVIYGLKGPDFYLGNPAFWAKMTAFAVVGALSVLPTIRIISWRRKSKTDPAFTLPIDEVRRVRGFFIAEAAVFALIPLFAAAMARGVGL
jgi:putative membrane protein